MIAEPQPTPYDLKFRLAGIPVRVHPLFWLVTLLMGEPALREPNPAAMMGIWIAVVFTSILVHEFGHAVAYRLFRSPARVSLYWFGGLAVSDYPPQRAGPRLLVSLAGPAAGFLLAGVVFATAVATGWPNAAPPFTEDAFLQLLWVNIGWGLFNLLPVIPLDGGRACRELCRLVGVRNADVVALKVSVGVGAAVAVYGLMNYTGQPREVLEQLPAWLRFRSLYVTLLFGILAYQNYQALQATRWTRDPSDDWDQARRPWR